AVGFCRQAALLEPNAPHAYSEALAYAKLGQDKDAMAWAAGNLLGHDWTERNDDLHANGQAELNDLARKLASGAASSDADGLRNVLKREKQRDLKIRLTWEGDADLDLKVKEPNGSVCSCLNRQTVGGGTLIGDQVGNARTLSESYVAARAFSGGYQVTVERIWGQPVGGKAKVEITLHAGTTREILREQTVDLKSGNSFTVNLADGRRTTLADVS